MKTQRFSNRLRTGALALLVLSGLQAASHAQAASAGLWVGTVSLNQVTDPKNALTQAGGTFEFRIIFHVSTAGTVKLLKDVIVMQRDHDNNTATAPQIVLVTDPAKIPNYSGVVRRSDGRNAGIRYAASAYDFTGLDHAAVGEIAADKELSYSLETIESSATNPFRHKFNPDHEKGRAYTRVVTVNFKRATAADTAAGTKRITGTYKETIKNLVNKDLQMAGTVTLDRISEVGALNP